MSECGYRLTKEQQELAAENHNLIYSFAHKMNLNIEEYYGILAIGLCYAAHKYDPNYGTSFSTLAYYAMKNEIYRCWKRECAAARRIPDELIVSYNSPMSDGRYASEYIEKLDDIFGTYMLDSTSVEIGEFFESLTDEENHILTGLTLGYSQREIGKKIGKSYGTVQRVYKILRKGWENGNYCLRK